ncbi:MAG: allophanate hydrolase [Acidobacteria bacterium]|nr:allophanate hydrolase [Acidobacteriota bacterium]
MTAWITEVDPATVAAAQEAARDLPLGGARLAVKDNIDVAGLPTTAAHPAFARGVAARSAAVVERLVAAGAVVAGKANLDQFATGLVGTRSPYGACANPFVGDRIAGGSSSGTALAIALGLAELGLGTDTAGSGRVPAALCGLVGLKPTPGLLPVSGVVPACPSLDCVSIMARTLTDAFRAMGMAAGPDPTDPWSRTPPLGTPVVGSGPLRVGIPTEVDLDGLDASARAAWKTALGDLARLGPLVEVDLTPYLDAGRLVYGSFVAERWLAVGEFLAGHPEGADPTVASIIASGEAISAARHIDEQQLLRRLRGAVAGWWGDIDVVVVPTVGEVPTLADVAADPVGVNNRLGRFTTGCNPLDLCAAAAPAGTRDDGVPFGVTFLGPAFADPLVAAAAARLLGEPDPAPPPWTGWTTVAVVGAHLSGQPLNGQLTERGGRLLRTTTTSERYRLAALPTTPAKPGMTRVADGEVGAAIEVEVWALPIDGFGDFVRLIPSPLLIGTVELADGSTTPGFLCESWAVADAPDITSYGGWRRYLAGT